MPEDLTTAGTTTATPAPGATAAPAAGTPAPSGDGATLLTGTEGTTGTPGATPEGGEAKVGAPEKYELKAGTIDLPAEVLAKYEPLFREAGLTNEAAQKLVDARAEELKAQDATAVEKLVAQHTEWLNATKADAEIGGANLDTSVKHAQSAIARFGSPELKSFLDLSGAGSHPELVRAFARIGKAMAEDVIVTGTTGGKGELSYEAKAKQMFPSMKN